MENIQWKVDGMSCTNCALSIHKYLSSKGIHEPKVNFMEGEVQFELADAAQKPALIKGIQGLGYKVRGQATDEAPAKKWLDNNKERAIFSLIFDKSSTRLISAECDKSIKIWQEDSTATPETHPIKYE